MIAPGDVMGPFDPGPEHLPHGWGVSFTPDAFGPDDLVAAAEREKG